MHIQIKTLSGKTETLSLTNTPSFDEITSQISNIFGVPTEEQRLILNGKNLKSGNFELKEESVVYLVVDVDGGKKKKKKKAKKPKRQHKKKKVNLAVVKYFKVEGGKVIRLRQKSPVGTFMAEHSDRYYCGKSHVTYKKKEDTPAADNKDVKKADAGKAAGKKK
jgi:small subunit ribosomal protein S27Ae